jgi:hypothetical protein
MNAFGQRCVILTSHANEVCVWLNKLTYFFSRRNRLCPFLAVVSHHGAMSNIGKKITVYPFWHYQSQSDTPCLWSPRKLYKLGDTVAHKCDICPCRVYFLFYLTTHMHYN